MLQYQPTGIFSLSLDPGIERGLDRLTESYVIFEANINKAIIIEQKHLWAGGGYEQLSELFGGKKGKPLRTALMRKGYQAVLRKDSEQIILDPNLTTIIRIGNI